MSTEEALRKLIDVAEQINVWPRVVAGGMGEVHAVEPYKPGCGDEWSIAFDVFHRPGVCFEVDWSDFKELSEAIDAAQQALLQKEKAAGDTNV